ncbi:MAG: MBL fold metallo-hydrolase [Rickettsiales bacterium]|nr:MBL fold metallo-hydrolase [Rickettsiales bacterium]|tara:strand:+ start:274 stop:1083 length:810 start_codon:yes stop_codon:yes gene_type:complete
MELQERFCFEQLKVVSLASGSKGNATVVVSGSSALLVDCGVSCKQVLMRMEAAGLAPLSLKGILITHEHSDHIAGLRVTAQRLKLPVYVSAAASSALRLPADIELHSFTPGEPFFLAGFEVEPFRIPHDSVDAVAYLIGRAGRWLGICTDLGSVTRLVIDKLKRCQLLLLEFNHDVGMLLDGPYPWQLKQRVRSRHGHLSNEQAGKLLEAVAGPHLEAVLLAHLSEKNNCPELALAAAGDALSGPQQRRVRLEVLRQQGPGSIITVGRP